MKYQGTGTLPLKRRSIIMNALLAMGLIVVIWIALQVWILPKMGIST